ncbi:MAG: polysaccharide deacetylase family protein, partial [Promicromonosporaceae bacterium]|nr:polysaccharide deacetylase family protein [Promicromonosporaceae bacterium]
VRDLAHHPLATVGAHTRTHPWLASLTTEEQLQELAGSRADLERMTGTRVDQLAYPYGARAAYGAATVRAARRAGFRLACSTRKGPVVRGTSRFRVPRFGVTEGPEPFEQRLTRWLGW